MKTNRELSAVGARLALWVAQVGLLVAIAACGGGGTSSSTSTAPPPPPPAAPTITSINNGSDVRALATQQTVAIIGTGFAQDSVVTLTTGGSEFVLPADRVIYDPNSPSTLNIKFTTSTAAAVWTVSVKSPGGNSSTALVFNVVKRIVVITTGTDGFDYPIGDKNYYTEARTTDDSLVDMPADDDWFVEKEAEFGDLNTDVGKYHFGEDWNFHKGGNTDLNEPIYAVANGTVVMAGAAIKGGWGNVLIIRHRMPDGKLVESLYGHVNSFEPGVVADATVTRGQKVALIGKAPPTTKYPDPFAHLHLEIRFEDCPDWGDEGIPYSVEKNPQGRTDPSDFIDANRPIVLVSDDDFVAWTSITAVFDDPTFVGPLVNKSSGNATRIATGGMVGAHLNASHTVFAGDSFFTNGIKSDFTYDPAVSGEIVWITVRGNVQGPTSGTSTYRLIVEQDGQLYYSTAYLTVDPTTSWDGLSFLGMPGDSFRAMDASGIPTGVVADFSQTGKPIRFGVSFSNRFTGGVYGVTSAFVTHRLDNFLLEIRRAPR